MKSHPFITVLFLSLLSTHCAPAAEAIATSTVVAAASTMTLTPTTTSTPDRTPTLTPSATPAPPGLRTAVDQPDEVEGYQIHAMYVIPSDGVDRHLDTNGTITTSVSGFHNWFVDQSGGSGLRLDMYEGQLDITFYRLPRSNAEIASYREYVRDQVQIDLHAAGFNEPHKLYAVYYDGLSNWSCGGGAWPPELVGNVAALYLHGAYGDVQCSDTPFTESPSAPGYWEYAMLHEILHTLGAAPLCAPNEHRRGHTSDDTRDIMYAGDSYWEFPLILDVGRDDYYGHSSPLCLDLAQSVFIDPLPANPVKPPGWP